MDGVEISRMYTSPVSHGLSVFESEALRQVRDRLIDFVYIDARLGIQDFVDKKQNGYQVSLSYTTL